MALKERHLLGLLAVRSEIAQFQQAGDSQARPLGLTHVQHHVLLSLRGHPHEVGPRVGDVARTLGIAGPSAVELVARMAAAGLLQRLPDADDRRATRLRLTRLGERLMHELGEGHLPHLRGLAGRAVSLLAD